jgi:hypothetical protein
MALLLLKVGFNWLFAVIENGFLLVFSFLLKQLFWCFLE